MSEAAAAPTGVLASVARIVRFTVVMYKPHYLLYGIVWVLALEATAALVTRPDTAWTPSGATLLRIVIVAFVLLYLRMVDEQKDLDYDRVHNPDRPLVTGAVRAGDLRAAMGVIAVGAVAASFALSVGSAVMIAVAMAYGLALWGWESLSHTVRTNILVSLVVTYPVQLLVTAYVVVSAIGTGQVLTRWPLVAVAVIFAGAFLQFEFARKTVREPVPGQLFYSNMLGPNGSAGAALGCAAVAVLVDLVLVRPWDQSGIGAVIAWIPLVLLLFPAWAGWRFHAARRAEHPVVAAVLFILTLYLTLIAQALVLTRG
ncbi:UbiA prenyltransferase family protein [Nocardia callitridis]|uniref:Prenyltransferase n=1 Tax=Nocardia callitridis TaxID=648753 RepID=A0ABP9L0A9_9NOCA